MGYRRLRRTEFLPPQKVVMPHVPFHLYFCRPLLNAARGDPPISPSPLTMQLTEADLWRILCAYSAYSQAEMPGGLATPDVITFTMEPHLTEGGTPAEHRPNFGRML